MSVTPRTSLAWRSASIAAAAAFVVAAAGPARAQGGVLLQGIVDGEAWSTSKTSNLLTRNAGRPADLGRVQLWGAYEPFRGWVVYAQGTAESGTARAGTKRREAMMEQFGLRYAASRSFVADVGRLAPVVGTFAARRLSTRNPLIGIPDGYSLKYPLGAEVSGETRHFDYRAAIISLPPYHDVYVPEPTPRLRPAVGGGFTPMTGLRFGASFTAGPYLNDSFAPSVLAGKSWSGYDQRVIAFDFSYAVGYLETRAEYARGSYDVPGREAAVAGPTYYGEVKYTFTPRFFLAGRAERNDYPFVRLFGASWVARVTDFVDGEVGGGYRLTASTLVKASVRGDRWWIAQGAAGFLGRGGRAVAVQVSQAFDVIGWIERER